ncbi:MAG: hypothetical protein GY774_38815 [Planctomycetes bacterium]|nr:hypothetical protein [Planctomycetota bacterium]
MARKRRSGKSKSEKEAEPKEEVSFLGELLSLICRAPFPFSAGGLVLKRIPPPWNKRALAIVLIAISILIVHPLVSPVRDLYYRVIPGPSVLVNFNNYTGESAGIDKYFEFWISENKNDYQSPKAIYDKRAMPDGAITIPPDTNEPVHIRLSRKQIIHRLYRGSGYLRLRFKVDGKNIEAENDCSTVISEGLSPAIYNPDKWNSQPIALWFSDMEDSTTNKDYLKYHSYRARRMITDDLDVFEILAFEPDGSDPNQTVLNIMVGCYRTEDRNENRLRLEIVENRVKLENTTITESYKSTDEFESVRDVERIVKRLRQNILYRYTPRGIIEDLDREYDPSEKDAPQREICLNIGRETGISRGDVFNILPVNQEKDIGKARVTHARERESTANLISDSEEVKKGCRLKWKNAGG